MPIDIISAATIYRRGRKLGGLNYTQESVFGVGLSSAQKVSRSFWGGAKFGASGILFGAGVAAFEAAHAERGAILPTFAGKGVSLMAYPVLAGFASAAVSLIPGIGPVAAAFMGTILAGYPDEMLGNSLSRSIRQFTGFAKSVRHLEMGGSYKDTESARRQRLIAVQDMTSALIPGRRYLGQEALLMHR